MIKSVRFTTGTQCPELDIYHGMNLFVNEKYFQGLKALAYIDSKLDKKLIFVKIHKLWTLPTPIIYPLYLVIKAVRKVLLRMMEKNEISYFPY